MLVLIWLSCFLLLVAGIEINRDLFLADITCRYYAHKVSQQRWDSGPARLKEYRRVFRACAMKLFQPHSIGLLTDFFPDVDEEERKMYGEVAMNYALIAPQAIILKLFTYDGARPLPSGVATRPRSVIVCGGSNGRTFAQGESGGLFDEAVLLNYAKDKPDVECVAERAIAFQQRFIPEATMENLVAFYHQRIARYPNALLRNALPIAAGTVELSLNKAITDYDPRTLGADFATEFGLLYHLNRSSRLVDNGDKMLEGLRNFSPS